MLSGDLSFLQHLMLLFGALQAAQLAVVVVGSSRRPGRRLEPVARFWRGVAWVVPLTLLVYLVLQALVPRWAPGDSLATWVNALFVVGLALQVVNLLLYRRWSASGRLPS